MGTTLITPKIVARLRLVFAVILSVLAIGLASQVFQIIVQKNALNQLSEVSIPVFVETRSIENRLRSLVVSTQDVEKVETLQELTTIQLSIFGQLDALRKNADVLNESGLWNDLSEEIFVTLGRFEKDIVHFLEKKRKVLQSRNSLSKLESSLKLLVSEIRVLLEDLSYEPLMTSASPDHTIGQKPADAQDQLRSQYYRNLVRANSITEMTLGMDSIVEAVLIADHIEQSSKFEKLKQNLLFKVRSLTVLVGQLEDNSLRIDLAQKISTFRVLIFGPNGVLDTVSIGSRRSTELNELNLAQRAPIDAISDLSNQLNKNAENLVEQSEFQIAATSSRLLIITSIANVILAVVIVLVMVLVVEKQINRRLTRLTQSVRAIASGDTNHAVNISGPDELGEVARALDVFKLNARELQRSNAELERFAYVAAHDLRSPLRAIQDLADWTMEDDGCSFSADGQIHMQLMGERIRRLNQLLSDLLEYSRAGKGIDDLCQVSISDVARESIEMLGQADRFTISYSGIELPLFTYSVPLRQILMNLISNAIKHHDQLQGLITVSSKRIDDRLHISVSDDGPGIAIQYQDRIFDLFQTLRPRDEVEGSGLGLAIIRKLVEHYGGEIRIESNPNLKRGSDFQFDLPWHEVANSRLGQAA